MHTLTKIFYTGKKHSTQKKATTHHPHSKTMRTTSVIKSISLSASQLKRRHLLFATQYDNEKIIIPVRTQFYTSNTRCQQQSTPFQHQEPERQQYQQQQPFQQNQFQSAILYQILNELKYR
jgi:hypothetical protein